MREAEANHRRRLWFGADWEPVLAFVFSRLLIWAVVCLALRWIPRGQFPIYHHGDALWNALFRWDANWYATIAVAGYEYVPGQHSNVGFFPLYPLCLAAVRALTGTDVALAGFIASNFFLLTAAILLRRLVALDFPAPSRVPGRTVWLLLLWPVSFFYSAPYTESLFLLLSISAFLAARRGEWALAGIAGALATATRANGVIIFIPLFYEALLAWRNRRASTRLSVRWENIRRSPFWVLVVPFGLLAFIIYLQVRFGDPLAFMHAYEVWGRRFASPWFALRNAWLVHPPGYGGWFVGTALGAVLLCILGWRVRLRPSYVFYTAAMLGLLLSQTILEAIPRYISVLFPLQMAIAAATVKTEGLYLAALGLSTALLSLCLTLYTCGYWMT